MRRTLEIVAVSFAAILFAELLFQVPLYRWLQPAILTPTNGAVVVPPLRVQWDGPPRLMVNLAADGAEPQSLGIRESPCELTEADLSKPGMYRLRVSAPLLGTLIQSERRFVVAAPTPAPSPPPTVDPRVTELTSSLNDLEAEHEKTRRENAALQQENAALRQENAALHAAPPRDAELQPGDAEQAAAQAERLAQLTQDNQALTDQVGVLQWQLNAALTCRVWGYYAFPRPQTFPPTRRTIMITNQLGELFRSEAECEAMRVNDPTTASRCFCVGTPWVG